MTEEIVFKNRLFEIFEKLSKSYNLLKEADEDTKKLSPEEQEAMDAVMKTVVDAIKKEKTTIQATAKDPNKIEKLEKQYDELGDLADTKQNEGQINELVITGTLIAGIVAAIPTLIKIFGYAVKGLGMLVKKFISDKAGDSIKKFADNIIHAGHELHVKYIKLVQAALVGSAPGFGFMPNDSQYRCAEVVYTIIVGILGIQAGIAAYDSFKAAQFLPGGIEGALSAIKGGEIGAYLSEVFAVVLQGAGSAA